MLVAGREGVPRMHREAGCWWGGVRGTPRQAALSSLRASGKLEGGLSHTNPVTSWQLEFIAVALIP